MKFGKGGRYRRSEVEGAPHYFNNFVRCGVGVEVTCHSVSVEVICHSTCRSGYHFKNELTLKNFRENDKKVIFGGHDCF